MVVPITITVATVDRTQVIPFKESADDSHSQLTIEVITPGTATAHIRIWDVNNSITFNKNDEVTVGDLTTPGHNLFNGYVSKRRIEVWPTFRVWDVDCVDLNSWLDLKIVGAPDGTTFLQDPPGTYTAVDKNAVSQKDDAATVQWLFSHYAADLPVDTTTFVGTYAPSLTKEALSWSTVTLRQALDDLASLANDTALRYWIDSDWFFHWTVVTPPTTSPGGPLILLFPDLPPLPAAPLLLTDGPADGITTINYEDFTVEYDDTQWADSVYVVGATGFTFVPPHAELIGGSGWVKGIGPVGRQRILTANNSDTAATRDWIGGQALANDSIEVVRGTATVTCKFGGWNPGQSIGLTNAIAGFANVNYMIQKATTTFLSGDGWRSVALEWGTAPFGTIGLRRQAQANQGSRNRPRRSAIRLVITVTNAKPGPGGVLRVLAQTADAGGTPWPIPNGVVTWTCSVFDQFCNDVTAGTNFVLSPQVDSTNANGLAWTDLTTDPNASNVTYYVSAVCVV